MEERLRLMLLNLYKQLERHMNSYEVYHFFDDYVRVSHTFGEIEDLFFIRDGSHNDYTLMEVEQ